jgi:hypothetical protein
MKKKFDQALFADTDAKARACGKQYWTSLGHTVEDNPDRYGADLIVDGKFYCEVEIKKVWHGETFQYDTLQIPHRKAKYTKLDMPCKFIVFNSTQSHGILVDGDVLSASDVKEVPNKYAYKGEMFFQVPIKNTTLISLEHEAV